MMVLAGLLMLWTATQVWAGDTDQSHLISANVPLNSYVYGYIDKLSGLGYLDDILDGTRPYSRMQVAQWVARVKANAANDDKTPTYIQSMLAELEKDFAKELVALSDGRPQSEFTFRRLSWETAYYDGPTLLQHKTASTYQPLNIDNNGYDFDEAFNHAVVLEGEGRFKNGLLLNITPHFIYNDDEDLTFSWESAYLKTHIGNMEIFLGKDALAWGHGQHGNLLLSGNSTPQTMLKLSTIDPLDLTGIFSFLNQANATFFYTTPESNRGDVKNPNMSGVRLSFKPSANFTFSLAGTAILGGDGHEIHWGDIPDLIIGKNADNSTDEKWNAIAGYDLNWRIPALRGLQLYAEYYGEDQKDHPIPHPFLHAHVLGFYLPKLNDRGDWDLRFEAAKTTKVWYSHWLYRDGYTFKDDIMGDAMGNNATRYYLNVTHYFNDAQLGMNMERTVMGHNESSPQIVNAFWLSYHRHIWGDLELDTTAGWAALDNVGYQEDATDNNYLLSVGLTKQF